MTVESTSISTAFERLRQLVKDAKTGSPFAPVTILVPSHASGLDVRRFLTRQINGGNGLVAVTCLTLADIAQHLFDRSGKVAGRSLLSSVVREGAVLSVLVNEAGVFAGVADQPATARALARASADLDRVTLTDAELPSLVADVVRVHRGASARLRGGWYTDQDVFHTATAQLVDPDVAADFGTIISFLLPPEPSAAEQRLLTALEAATSITTVTTDAPADADALLTDARVLSITDADDEARTVARIVVEHLQNDIPGHRIGVFWGTSEPYRVLLHRHFAEAGITVNGPAARKWSDTAYVRGLLALLSIDPADIDRRQVLDVLAEGLLSWSVYRLPSSAACERMFTSEAVEEPAPQPKLVFVEVVDNPADDIQRAKFEQQTLFESYLTALSAGLTAVGAAGSWEQAATALDALLAEHFAPIPTFDEELTASREALSEAIKALRRLDGVAPAPTQRSVQAALAAQIEATPRSHGTVGTGVTLGSLTSGVARDLDVVIVLGLAEGITPTRLRDDALLPDAVRELWGGALPLLAERAASQKLSFLNTLASGTKHRVVTYPRGNLRGGGERGASRWLTTRIEASKPTPANPDPATAPVEVVGSYYDGILTGTPVTGGIPVSAQTWRLRQLRSQGANDVIAPADAVLARALAMRADRASGAFTRFNGNLSSRSELLTVLDRSLTATSLEDWVSSPLSYFLQKVLGLRVFTDVQLEVEIDPLTRGTLLHEILEDHVAARIAGTTDAHTLEALLALAELAFIEYKATSWIDHLWKRDMNIMRRDLKNWWARHDEAASDGWLPHLAEAAFGLADEQAFASLPFTLADDTEISFSGKVDRIDYAGNGSIRVVDYKAGGSKKFESLSAENPTANSTKFQLPVYGLFAQAQGEANHQTGPVRAEYDFVASTGGQKTIGYAVTEQVVELLRGDVSAIVAAIRIGVFPPKPSSGSFKSISSMTGADGLESLWSRVSPGLDPELFDRFWLEEAK